MFARRKVHLSIGPDCSLSTKIDALSIVAFLMLLGVSYGLHMIEKLAHLGPLGTFINYAFMVFPPLAFLAAVLKNPGIYDPE